MRGSLLVVDDDVDMLRLVSGILKRDGYDVDTAHGGKEGLQSLRAKHYHVLVVDLSMPDITGIEVMKQALRQGRCQSAILMTGDGSIPVAIDAIRSGASDFLTKPFLPKQLLDAVHKAMGFMSDTEENFESWRRRYASDVIGNSFKMNQLLQMVRKVSTSDCDVLITGGSGTGKELIARCIHMSSQRADHPFVALNCAAIPKELMESEIFGHAKGSFTGATERRAGKFQIADGGTLFLDEVGEMDLSLQGKFLRVIQEKEFTPVGDSKVIRSNVRIVSATNQDLEARCREKLFREDLYYRLNVVPLTLPTLAERKEDVPLLVSHFIHKANARHHRNVVGLTDEAIDVLLRYSWPGNVRELQNLIERLVVLKSNDAAIALSDLPKSIVQSPQQLDMDGFMLPEEGMDMNSMLTQVEIKLTLDALARSHGNKAKAAELLGLKRTTLVERLKKLNIQDA